MQYEIQNKISSQGKFASQLGKIDNSNPQSSLPEDQEVGESAKILSDSSISGSVDNNKKNLVIANLIKMICHNDSDSESSEVDDSILPCNWVNIYNENEVSSNESEVQVLIGLTDVIFDI